MIETPDAICIDGWTAIYRDGAPTSANGSFHQGWEMQAVTLDSLLSEEDSQQQRHDLGRSVGINTNRIADHRKSHHAPRNAIIVRTKHLQRTIF